MLQVHVVLLLSSIETCRCTLGIGVRSVSRCLGQASKQACMPATTFLCSATVAVRRPMLVCVILLRHPTQPRYRYPVQNTSNKFRFSFERKTVLPGKHFYRAACVDRSTTEQLHKSIAPATTYSRTLDSNFRHALSCMHAAHNT